MFIASGIGPYSAPVCPLKNFAPADNDYGVKRYEFEAKRHWGILNDRLEGRDWIVGDSYSFVDMAAWGWERLGGFVLGAEEFDKLANIKRHLAAINARPAAARAEAIKTRHAFKAEMDERSAEDHVPPHRGLRTRRGRGPLHLPACSGQERSGGRSCSGLMARWRW